ncbi:sugar ABC transporter substrate-binding protein [Marinomonas lutimaris]|uniref:sugar ABC transporter substrate-binding protein n=1 Tax=Marinomonas lutimaris TaxID=2846746 RepID=UPI001C679F5E|nr:sugar ABC transporter substrate-binding protein [Marinomonas lutimaris]
MKKIITAAMTLAILATPALADSNQPRIGVTLFSFDDNFLSVLRNNIETSAKKSGVNLQVEDAQNEIGVQLNQIQNFIASGVDAIIVNTVDSDATMGMSDAAEEAGIPLVYVGRHPININMMPDNQAFVGSNELESGTLQAQEVCRLLDGKGKAVIMMGTIGDNNTTIRTKDVHDVFATPECSGIEIIEQQSANFMRTEGNNLMSNWLTAGLEFDAVIANNDEMALGAIQALKATGRSMDSVIVAGIDATSDALSSMKAGDLDVTVFQNGAAQGSGAVQAALQLINNEEVEQKVWIPFELVTPENMADYNKLN